MTPVRLNQWQKFSVENFRSSRWSFPRGSPQEVINHGGIYGDVDSQKVKITKKMVTRKENKNIDERKV